MSITRGVGRLLLSGIFIKGGLDAFRQPGGRVEQVAQVGIPQPRLAVRLNGLLMALAGVMLALDVTRRLAAAALAASIVPTTLVGHAFWRDRGPTRSRQTIQFFKNLGLLGGLLLVLGK